MNPLKLSLTYVHDRNNNKSRAIWESLKKEMYSDKSNRDKSKEYKRRKNQIKEDYLYDEYSEYNIRIHKRDRSPM